MIPQSVKVKIVFCPQKILSAIRCLKAYFRLKNLFYAWAHVSLDFSFNLRVERFGCDTSQKPSRFAIFTFRFKKIFKVCVDWHQNENIGSFFSCSSCLFIISFVNYQTNTFCFVVSIEKNKYNCYLYASQLFWRDNVWN